MRQLRYQIFISSTFRDLQEERQAVLDAILNMNYFPAGMELFPASNATPWDVIEQVISDSDYYILIVGGMYGSTDSDGISYTEREYDFAKSQNKPILAFLHKNPSAIPSGKVEMETNAQKKLAEFRQKVQKHHCKYWEDTKELQYLVAISLIQEVNRSPAIGWIRANEASNEDLLKRIERLTQENERLRELVESQRFINQLSNQFPSTGASRQQSNRAVKLFYSYAHKDEGLRNELETHLKLLQRQGLIESWHDRMLEQGDKWKKKIDDNIETADIILFLVSADFLASDYLFENEVKRALERHKLGEAQVIPVILRPCDWMSSPFGQLQALPKDGQPVVMWTNRDAALLHVAKGIRAVAGAIKGG